jgi:hypothetical protein
MTEQQETCIWCPGHPTIPASQFDEHLTRTHPSIPDPHNATPCRSRAEIDTPDGVIRDIACGRASHRWGKHRNADVRWACPPHCTCVRHTR